MNFVSSELLKNLLKRFEKSVERIEESKGELSILVKKDSLKEVLKFLKDSEDFQMDMLVDLTAIDMFPKRPRFIVVYLLRSLKKKHHLRVKCQTDEVLPSVVDIWKSAEWLEREVYEMFGVKFEGRNLKRLLLPQNYPYFPLRKDFPLEGYEKPCDIWD